MVLVLDSEIEQHPLADQHLGQRRKEPGTQAVGIECRDHHQRCIAALGQIGQQIRLEQRGALEVLQQALSGFGGTAGPTAYHQGAAQRTLQRTHALRNGRRRQMQPLRSLLEATGANDGTEGFGLLRIEIHDGTDKENVCMA